MEPITIAEVLRELPSVLSSLVFDYHYSFKILQKQVIEELKFKFSGGRWEDRRWITGPEILADPALHGNRFGVKYFIQSRIFYRIQGEFEGELEDAFNFHKTLVR